MVKAFLDTNIIVDLLRKHPIADQWLTNQSDLGVTRAVWLECSSEQKTAKNSSGQYDCWEILNW